MATTLYNFEMTAKPGTGVLFHNYDVNWHDYIKAWTHDPENSKYVVPGDDRTPAFKWIGYLHHDGQHIAVPYEVIMAALRGGGGMVLVGKGKKTYKAQTQSGCAITEPFCKILLNGKPIPMSPIEALKKESVNFDKHKETVEKMGFSLFVKPVRIGTATHIRVRPRIDNWSIVGQLNVWDDQLTLATLQQIFTYAGSYRGILNWRPGCKTPGPFGTFDVKVTEV